MAPSSSRPMQKLGGAMILVVAVLCVSVSVPTVSAQRHHHRPSYRPKHAPTYEPQPYAEDLCNPYYYRPSPKHPAYFLQRHAGGYFQEMPCAPGTVYNPDLCVCDFPKDKGPSPPHRPYAKPAPPPTPKPPKHAPYISGRRSFSGYSKTRYDDSPSYDDNSYHQDSYSGRNGYGYD